VGAEADPDAANLVRGVLAGRGDVRVTDAADTGLPDASADVVIGEAMLSMQGDAAKHAIVAEAARVLRPGGRYAIHEVALTPDDVAEEISTDVRQSLARAIKVNARPLTVSEWSQLLAGHGLVVKHVATAPMALLQPRRVLADEGLFGALRFAKNLLAQPAARKRVLSMRSTFRRHRERLTAVAIIAYKPRTSGSWYGLAEIDQAVPEESRGGPINYSEVGSGDGSRLGPRLVRAGQVGVARAGSSASIHRDCGPVLRPRH